jgi:hypothetical protein
MADEGAGGNIAGEECGADDPGDQRGERQRLPQQALLRERGAAKIAVASSANSTRLRPTSRSRR